MIRHCYIHVPFCNSICSYCDFTHQIYKREKALKWLEEIRKEITGIKETSFDTIYLGGGTPSALDTDILEALLQSVYPFLKKNTEYTIEVNPESCTPCKIECFKKYGINRISMGLEASQPCLLSLMNRKHNLEDVKQKVQLLRTYGIDNISLDAMYSFKDQTVEMFKETLSDMVNMNVPHISIYSLTIEPDTALGKKGYCSSDEDREADMYEMAVTYLKENGYEQYEISNFAKDHMVSRHNIGYWQYDDFYGIGCGASGKENHMRYDNTRNINRYIEGSAEKNIIPLTEKEERFENIMMSLRMIKGMDINLFNQRYHCDFEEVYKNVISKLLKKDYIVIENNGFIRCKNIALCNEVLIEFMD